MINNPVVSSAGGGAELVTGNVQVNAGKLYYLEENENQVKVVEYPNGNYSIRKNSIIAITGIVSMLYECSGDVQELFRTGGRQNQTAAYYVFGNFHVSGNG